jgi:hypothetical protein
MDRGQELRCHVLSMSSQIHRAVAAAAASRPLAATPRMSQHGVLSAHHAHALVPTFSAISGEYVAVAHMVGTVVAQGDVDIEIYATGVLAYRDIFRT